MQGSENAFFETKIRPVLAEKCYECHSARADKIKGGLRLDHIDLILVGGDTGPALVRGNPEESLIVNAISYVESDFSMPPKGKLQDSQIANIETWIKNGAVWPDEPVPELSSNKKRSVFNIEKRTKEHWCWQPIKSPSMAISESSNLHPIDQLVREKLDYSGLLPSESTDRRTWLRRVSYDLTGLPPSLADIENFLSDHSDNSFEVVVDRLLASPHYGEKWARHWMDLVRYAETCGHEFDYPLEHPHEYRDYLIRAFNQDVPYDQFLIEHVAGDLIEKPRLHPESKFNESIIGTGFWYFHEAVHAPTDPKVDNADRMENQLDVFGKTFLGLTIGCARCHDHKFDAISEKDYYSLAAYMQGSTRQEYPLDVEGGRKKIADEIQQLCRSAFSSLSTSQKIEMTESSPSKYWKTALSLISSNYRGEINDSYEIGTTFADFENGFGNWKPVGNAFSKTVSKGSKDSHSVLGYSGVAWASSFNKDPKKSKGLLVSPKFKVEQRFLNFLVGGGAFNEVGVELWSNGQPVITSRGKNSDQLFQVSWDLEDYVNKEVEIRLVDKASGKWGHIHADQFEFSKTPKTHQPSKPVPPFSLIESFAKAGKFNPKTLSSWCIHLSKQNNLQSFSQRITGAKKTHAGLVNAESNFIQKSQLFANFTSAKIPDGWKVSGEAFKPRGNQLISFDEATIFPNPNVLSSNILGDKRIGNLRSPHFKIEHDQILVKAKASKIFMRVVIDNYHMGKHSGLLFGGTVIKEAESNEDYKWFTLSPKKFKGHWAYLEFVDRGKEAYLEIDQIRFANSGIGKIPDSRFSFLLSTNDLNGNNLPEFLDDFVQKSISRISSDELTSDEYSFLNYLYSEGLVPLGNQKLIDEILSQAKTHDSKTPPERYVLAMGKGSSYPGNVYVRGNPHSLGDPVKSRNLSALGGREGDRLELANQLVSKDNPLVARVMVNRIWLQFFGRGIVPTPDDFGPMGQEPSHPELLDWLATNFRENNWSVKHLIRQIVLSQTYGQSSTSHPKNTEEKIKLTDPQNILLHKMPIRRMQAEAIRDSILAFSGRLDRKLFGPSIPIYKTAFMTGRGGKKNGPLDGAGRRSIYGSVYRNFLSPFMLAFDQPAPFGTKGRRSVSNVPAQSLALLNDPFVLEQCRKMGSNLHKDNKTKRETIHSLHQMITGKPPSQNSENQLLAFLETQTKAHGEMGEQVWADLAHVLINSKNFLFLN